MRTRLVAFFTAGRRMASITASMCDEWVDALRAKFARTTAAKTIKRARQIFKAAVRKGILATNPLADVKAGSEENRDRMHFVSRDIAEQVIAACPDAEWKAIFALARYGALRCPSELAELKWGDIDFKGDCMMQVRSPKLKGKKTYLRAVPIFDEVYPHLAALYDEACQRHDFEDPKLWKDEKVIPRARHGHNLATQLNRIIIKGAGIKPMIPPKGRKDPKGKNDKTDIGQAWPRLMQNCRSSRQSELLENPALDIVLVCEWLGNSPAVAASTTCKQSARSPDW